MQLVEYSENSDVLIGAALVHSACGLPYPDCRKHFERLSPQERLELFKTALRHMQFYDSVLREFEYAHLTFAISLSAACFGQLKRHRMSTITAQGYEPALGVTVPESITEIGMDGYFKKIIAATNDAYKTIKVAIPLAAAYILTNAHRRRVLMRVNPRELYHISRLREDVHAQWDIRNISCAMTVQAKQVMPLAFVLAGGKDNYHSLYQNMYGEPPKVTEAVLPGVRKIK